MAQHDDALGGQGPALPASDLITGGVLELIISRPPFRNEVRLHRLQQLQLVRILVSGRVVAQLFGVFMGDS